MDLTQTFVGVVCIVSGINAFQNLAKGNLIAGLFYFAIAFGCFNILNAAMEAKNQEQAYFKAAEEAMSKI